MVVLQSEVMCIVSLSSTSSWLSLRSPACGLKKGSAELTPARPSSSHSPLNCHHLCQRLGGHHHQLPARRLERAPVELHHKTALVLQDGAAPGGSVAHLEASGGWAPLWLSLETHLAARGHGDLFVEPLDDLRDARRVSDGCHRAHRKTRRRGQWLLSRQLLLQLLQPWPKHAGGCHTCASARPRAAQAALHPPSRLSSCWPHGWRRPPSKVQHRCSSDSRTGHVRVEKVLRVSRARGSSPACAVLAYSCEDLRARRRHHRVVSAFPRFSA